MKNFILLLLAVIIIPTSIFAQRRNQQQKITLEDIWSSPKFFARGLHGIMPMEDGEHYARQHFSPTGDINLIRYSFADANFSDTIFSSTWTPEVFGIQQISFSADESKLILTTDINPIYRYSYTAGNYIYDRQSRQAFEVFNNQPVMYADVSPNGTHVAFVYRNNLYIQNLENGDTTQITNDGERNRILNGMSDWVYEEEFGLVQAFQWAPQGNAIAYYRFDESRVKEYHLSVYNDVYPELYTFKYPKTGEDNSLVSIHVYHLENGNTVKIDTGEEEDQYIPRIKWTKKEGVLSIQRMNRLQNSLELLYANAVTGESQVIMVEESNTYIDIHDNLTFIDENWFLWTSDLHDYNHIFLYDSTGRMLSQITHGEWEVSNFLGYDEVERMLYFTSTAVSPMERYVYRVHITGGEPQKLVSEKGTHTASFSGFKYFIHSWSDANTPPVISIRRSDGTLVRQVEDNTALRQTLATHNLPQKEFFTFTTSDGVELNGWMIRPNDFRPRRQYPVVMMGYGGPGSQTVLNSWQGIGDMWYRYLAQEGYIVVSIDNRGTGGRGRDFKKMTYLNLGHYETLDFAEAARYLSRERFVDGGRIGIYGWSYGGYLSSLAMAKYPDLFSTAIAVAPVTDWHFYDNIYTERFMRKPSENEEGYRNSSVIYHAEGLRGKNYMLVHGTFDDNVHPHNAFELMKELIDKDIEFNSEMYPDYNHSIWGGKARLHLFRRMTNFLNESLF